jgi:hypothetical protein
MKTLRTIILGVLLAAPQAVFAAIGCTLSNPAEDLKYLFPEMTSYKEELKEFGKLQDGEKLFKSLKDRLGSDLDPIYETFETPYTVYFIYRGKTKMSRARVVSSRSFSRWTRGQPPSVSSSSSGSKVRRRRDFAIRRSARSSRD